MQRLFDRRSCSGTALAALVVAGLLLAIHNSSVWFGSVASAQAEAPAQGAPQARPLPPERDLAMKIPGAFNFSGVGDIILRHPVSQLTDPNFQGLVQHLRDADIAFANMEGTIIDFGDLPHQGIQGGMPKSGIADLKALGIKIMNHANNHTMDTGVEGMLQTDKMLDQAGIAHAGSGSNLQSARGAAYVSTPKGIVGLVGMFSIDPTSSPSPASTSGATYRVGDQGGIPGVNGLHVTAYNVVTQEQMDGLRKIRDAVYARRDEVLDPVPPVPANEPKDRLQLFGQWYKAGPKAGDISWVMNAQDEKEILRSIRNAKEYADFVIATIHCHQGNYAFQRYTFDDDVPDFLVELAHQAIDNGADVFIGHGVHTLRGVEIYKGRPIFYGVSNFFNELAQSSMPQNPGGELTQAEDANRQNGTNPFTQPDNLEALLTTAHFEDGRLTEVRIYPADLGRDLKRPLSRRGVPMTPSLEAGKQILDKLQKFSDRFGTKFSVENNVAVIRVAPSGPERSRTGSQSK